MIEYSAGGIEKKSIAFDDDQKTHCLFHKAPGAGRKPTVLYIPGMDQNKEDVPNPWNNDYTIRGMNICSMDGPGQGECNFNGVWQTEDNYQKAASQDHRLAGHARRRRPEQDRHHGHEHGLALGRDRRRA